MKHLAMRVSLALVSATALVSVLGAPFKWA